jgi:hypothetical protein
MTAVKIQCGCGQKYAFEVEAVAGRMPAAVACPVCGADGTQAANMALAQSIPAQGNPARPVVHMASAPGSSLRVAAPTFQVEANPSAVPTAAPRGPGMRAPQTDRTQAEHEARAKISWGDEPNEVVKFLMIQGFSYEEANATVNGLFVERAKAIRRNGVKKIFIGAGLMCLPIITFLVCLAVGYLPLKLLGATVVVGLWGAWMVLKGIIMMVAPKSEPGDVAEQ